MSKATHIVRCIKADWYTTKDKLYEAYFDTSVFYHESEGNDALIIDDEGDEYFLFPNEYEIVGPIGVTQ